MGVSLYVCYSGLSSGFFSSEYQWLYIGFWLHVVMAHEPLQLTFASHRMISLKKILGLRMLLYDLSVVKKVILTFLLSTFSTLISCLQSLQYDWLYVFSLVYLPLIQAGVVSVHNIDLSSQDQLFSSRYRCSGSTVKGVWRACRDYCLFRSMKSASISSKSSIFPHYVIILRYIHKIVVRVVWYFKFG